MSDPSRFAPSMRGTFACAALMLGLAAGACAGPGDGAPAETRSAVATGTGASRNLDVLFVVDDAPGMEPMQQALYDQIPTFMEMLSNPVSGLGNLHIGVISADVGAPGDASASLGCTTTGDTGKLQSVPRGGCTDSTITPGDSFISFVAGVPNFEQDSMAEVSISNVLRCILPLGGGGCMFQQPLAAIARALGADGAPPPAVNTGFLRPDAALVIFILSNQDDCSAPASSALFSLGGKADDLANPLGPLAHYRCNAFGHLCVDPSGDPTAHISPPLTPPADAQGTAAAPTLDLVQCASNESGAYLTPVSSLLSEIRSLKADPDNHIVVGAIVAPPSPYSVRWVSTMPPGGAAPVELEPVVEHACGPAGSDLNPAAMASSGGAFGDPAVRTAQFVAGFGASGASTSICNADYAGVLTGLVAKIEADADRPAASPSGAAGEADAGGASTGAGGGAITGTGATSGTNTGGGAGSSPGVMGVDGLRETGCAGGCDVGSPGSRAWVIGLALVALAGTRRHRR